ncbi:hypothetical protein BpHYR1_054352 [Brachionus plicatilis]|uniref:Uncharacterized protein n=1 Tax=Brachionus plicatilis TaxID=10195 RepID=A0A3M7RE10_BRAPC|nr:hypothetical protein BpHYR1_054352 [Brachionus plicatilis]
MDCLTLQCRPQLRVSTAGGEGRERSRAEAKAGILLQSLVNFTLKSLYKSRCEGAYEHKQKKLHLPLPIDGRSGLSG